MMNRALASLSATDLETAASWGTVCAIFILSVLNQIHLRRTKDALALKNAQDALAQQANMKRLDEIHSLVNGDLTEQLRVIMILTQRVADLSNNEEDRAVAKKAAQTYTDHLTAQMNSLKHKA